MADQKLQGEVQRLIESLLKTTLLLSNTYESQLKILALLVLAWVSFKVGKKTVADPLEKQVKDIKKTLANRQLYTVALPAKIKQISRNMLITFVLTIIPAIAYFSRPYIDPSLSNKIDLTTIIIVEAFLAMIVLLMWFYQLFLKFKLSRGRFNDHHMQQNLTAILKTLGGKSQSLLKHYLCNDSMGKLKSSPIGICSKQKCKQYRSLLKDKSDCITILVENVINFQWCSICKKRTAFDQFLSFKAAVYSKKETKNEDEEVSDRNLYLLDQIEKMAKWAKELGPCNCSMRYWDESKKEIVLFKKRQKDADQRLALFEARENLKR